MPGLSRAKQAVLGSLALAVVAVLLLRCAGEAPRLAEQTVDAPLKVAEIGASAPAQPPTLALPAPDPEPTLKAALVNARWGSSPGELGRDLPEDHHASPVGPMSFAVGPDGQLYVLDQVNGRIVRFDRDGKYLGSFPSPQSSPQDLALAPDGSVLVLDRLGNKSVALLDGNGYLKGELPLSGPGFKDDESEPHRMPEAVTGILVDGDGVYVEQAHGSVVRVGGLDGTVDAEQSEVPGRPSKDGLSYVFATVVDPFEGLVLVNSVDRTTLERRFSRQLQLGLPVLDLTAIDTDATGVIYLAAMLEVPVEQDPAPGAAMIASPRILRLVCLAPEDGSPIGLSDLPPNETPEETFRDLQILPGGGVLYGHRSADGIRYERYDCR